MRKLLLALLCAVLVSSAALVGSRGSAESAERPLFSGITNAGTPVAPGSVDSRQRDLLSSSGVRGSLHRLAVVDGTAYYSALSTSGGACFLTGPSDGETARFAEIICQPAGGVFPSSSNPVLDFSTYLLDADTGKLSVVTILGFATDDIGSVALEGADGESVEASVVKNVYSVTAPRSIAVSRLVARSRNGSIVYMHPLQSR